MTDASLASSVRQDNTKSQKMSNSNKNWDCRRNFPSTLLILLRGRSEVGRRDAQTSLLLLLLLVGWWPAPLRRGHRGRRGCARHKAHDLDTVLLELGLVCWAAGRSVSPTLATKTTAAITGRTQRGRCRRGRRWRSTGGGCSRQALSVEPVLVEVGEEGPHRVAAGLGHRRRAGSKATKEEQEKISGFQEF
jgi:hypothetical protein